MFLRTMRYSKVIDFIKKLLSNRWLHKFYLLSVICSIFSDAYIASDTFFLVIDVHFTYYILSVIDFHFAYRRDVTRDYDSILLL